MQAGIVNIAVSQTLPFHPPTRLLANPSIINQHVAYLSFLQHERKYELLVSTNYNLTKQFKSMDTYRNAYIYIEIHIHIIIFHFMGSISISDLHATNKEPWELPKPKSLTVSLNIFLSPAKT